MSLKRLLAFMFDLILISIVSSLIFISFFKSQWQEVSNKSEELAEIIRTTGSTGLESKTKELEDKSYEYNLSSSTNTIINISLQIGYFIFLQYFLNGQTIGKKLFKLRVKPIKEKKLNTSLFVLREIIILGLPFQILDVVLILATSQNTYLKFNPLISNAKFILYLAIIGTIIFRNDERALHDLVGNTKVVFEKEEKTE